MLARLGELECARNSEVDYRGEYLRLPAADDACVSDVRVRLSGAGYDSDILREPDAEDLMRRVARWYPAARAGELSRVEAEVLAREIAPAFIAQFPLTIHLQDLEHAIATGLETCFVNHPLGAQDAPAVLSGLCGSAVAAAASAVLAVDDAQTLGRFVNERLNRFGARAEEDP